MNPAAPWYESENMKGIVVTIVLQLLALAGVHLSTTQVVTDVAAVFQVVALLAALYAGVKRWRSQMQPLTVTQKAAENHPATIAATAPAVVPPTP